MNPISRFTRAFRKFNADNVTLWESFERIQRPWATERPWETERGGDRGAAAQTAHHDSKERWTLAR